MSDRPIKQLARKARRVMRGYPIGTVAYYGPDDKRATKLVGAIIVSAGAEPDVRTWFVDSGDARSDPVITAELLAYFKAHDVKSVTMMDRIFGCPHQQGIDYQGEYCPVCTFWVGRDRYTGKKIRPT